MTELDYCHMLLLGIVPHITCFVKENTLYYCFAEVKSVKNTWVNPLYFMVHNLINYILHQYEVAWVIFLVKSLQWFPCTHSNWSHPSWGPLIELKGPLIELKGVHFFFEIIGIGDSGIYPSYWKVILVPFLPT